MIPRLLFALLLACVGCAAATAQTFRPLAGYEQLADRPATGAIVLKRDCPDFAANEDFTRLLPGETLVLDLELDTFNLGENPRLRCEGCNVATAGTAFLIGDTLNFTANTGIEQATDVLTFQACSQDGSMCNDEVTVSILVQRPGRTIDLGAVNVDPDDRIDLPFPDATDLPGGPFCRSVELCGDDFAGRDQEIFFLFRQADGNDVRYRSGRYGGTDAVCVTICNELGLCDTYRTEVTVNRAVGTLPFFDDFSNAGARPLFARWQDEDVLINRTLSDTPPSLGVATFDAVDGQGFAYAAASNGSTVTSPRDYLTSIPLDMINQDEAELSFYLQPRGLGNRPETNDSFMVQFLTAEGNWRTVLRVAGQSPTNGVSVEMPFEPYVVPVTDEYLYNGFQFRFLNKSSEAGAVDMWHLDYVKLVKGDEGVVTRDLALQRNPASLTAPYTALPLRHYQGSGPNTAARMDATLRESYRLNMRNHDDEGILNDKSAFLIEEVGGSFFSNLDLLLFPDVFPGVPVTIPPLEQYDLVSVDPAPEVDVLAAYLDGLDAAAGEYNFSLTYTLSPTGERFGLGQGVFENNIARTVTNFGEYMAYDDGTAEVTIEGDNGTTVVQAYTAYVEDDLKGIQIRIPRGLGGLGDQSLNLVVYTGDSVPRDLIYEEAFPIRYAEASFRDTLEGFTTYLFDETVTVPEGRFFVGWRQAGRNNRNIGIGYDRNNVVDNVQYFSQGFGFNPVRGAIRGAIMIRPLLSGYTGFATSTTSADDAGSPPLVTPYPNPTGGPLHLRPRPQLDVRQLNYRLLTITGRQLRGGILSGSALDLSDLPGGVYLLEVTGNGEREQHKIVRH